MLFCDFFSPLGHLNMAAIRERTTFTLEEVSGFSAISVEGNGSIDENHESAGEEIDSC